MTTPAGYGEPALPKRNGTRGMLPSTWLDRELRVQYVAGDGYIMTTTATLLDWYPFGPVLNLAGAKTLIAWDRLTQLELVDD